ncbi:MAG: M23 family metallopeptidase, partial [Chloroflexota bacterium]
PHRLQLHEGLDFAPKHTAVAPLWVVAAADGEIIKVGFDARGYGNFLVIRHDEGWETWYGHLAEPPPKQSGLVVMGETIGAAGNTGGTSTGVHLHFNTVHNGYGLRNYVVDYVVDPEPLLIREPPLTVVLRGLPKPVIRSLLQLAGTFNFEIV